MVDGDIGFAGGQGPSRGPNACGPPRTGDRGSTTRPSAASSWAIAPRLVTLGHRHPAAGPRGPRREGARCSPPRRCRRGGRAAMSAASTSPAARYASTSTSSALLRCDRWSSRWRRRCSSSRLAAAASPRASNRAARDSEASASVATPWPTSSSRRSASSSRPWRTRSPASRVSALPCRAGQVPSRDPQAGVELPLGVHPATLGRQHAAVGDAALGIQERAAVGVDEVVRGLAPLVGALDITRQLAGVEHVAARVHDGVERRALAGQAPRPWPRRSGRTPRPGRPARHGSTRAGTAPPARGRRRWPRGRASTARRVSSSAPARSGIRYARATNA